MTANTTSMSTPVGVAIPGTAGELVQGTLDGVPCLISCPIPIYSTAEVRLSAQPGWTTPKHANKARAAMRRTLTRLGSPICGGQLRLRSRLPRGRGYASSTADIGATIFALSEAFGRRLLPREASTIAVDIEPTDSSLLRGLALWAHRTGERAESLGPPPGLAIIVLDPGGEVDTQKFNARDRATTMLGLAAPHKECFDLARIGIVSGNAEALAAAATLSAVTHQKVLHSSLIDPALEFARDVGALGICRAHSGTLVGVLLDGYATDVPELLARARKTFAEPVRSYAVPLVGGGPRLVSPARYPASATDGARQQMSVF